MKIAGLRKGLPIQQVAKLHNTSVKMIERHYAKYIATALEDLARAAVVPLVPRSDGNVVPVGKRTWPRQPLSRCTLFCCRFERLVTEVNGTVAERVSVNLH